MSSCSFISVLAQRQVVACLSKYGVGRGWVDDRAGITQDWQKTEINTMSVQLNVDWQGTNLDSWRGDCLKRRSYATCREMKQLLVRLLIYHWTVVVWRRGLTKGQLTTNRRTLPPQDLCLLVWTVLVSPLWTQTGWTTILKPLHENLSPLGDLGHVVRLISNNHSGHMGLFSEIKRRDRRHFSVNLWRIIFSKTHPSGCRR